MQFIKICNEAANVEQAGYQPTFKMLNGLQLSQLNTIQQLQQLQQPERERGILKTEDSLIIEGNTINNKTKTITNLQDTYYKTSFIKKSKDMVKPSPKRSIRSSTSPLNRTL